MKLQGIQKFPYNIETILVFFAPNYLAALAAILTIDMTKKYAADTLPFSTNKWGGFVENQSPAKFGQL